MARQQAIPSQLAGAMLTRLQAITSASGSLTDPKSVTRGMSVDVANRPMPGLYLWLQSINPDLRLQQKAANVSFIRTSATWYLLCTVAWPVTAPECEDALNNLMADAKNALQSDFQLGGLLATGYLDIGAISYEPGLSSDGYTTAKIEITATWQWSTDTGP